MRVYRLLCVIALGLAACDAPDFVECDGAPIVEVDGVPSCADAGPALDAGSDAGRMDAGPLDAGPLDAGPLDAGHLDGGLTDAGSRADGGADAGVGLGVDAPDCLDDRDCPFDSRSVLAPTAGSDVSITDRIDATDHTIPTACGDVVSTDRDVFRVQAPARTMLEIEVVGAPGSRFRPVLEAYDINLGYVIAFEHSMTDRARLIMVSPAPAPEGLLVQVEQLEAYLPLCGGAPPTYRGGADHGYTITARVCESCAIQELGDLGSGLSATASQGARGDMTVYRFTGPVEATPSVTVALAGACPASLGSCCPIVVPLAPGGDTPPLVRANYSTTAGRTCDGDSRALTSTNGSGERLFAVYDYESAGAPGYAIDVTVTP